MKIKNITKILIANSKKISAAVIVMSFSLAQNIAIAQTQKLLQTIVVDAGHGGTDPGASGQYEGSLKTLEKDVTLGISLKLVAELRKRLPDVKTVPTRTTDIYQSPREKANIANQAKGDLFICIHADSRALKTGKRQVGTQNVKKYKTSYTGSGKKRKKVTTSYYVEEPIYQYYKMPYDTKGTSVYLFAAHKTSDKLKAISNAEEDIIINTDAPGEEGNIVDFSTPAGQMIAQVYAKRFQEKSNLIATFVNDEVEKTGREALGVNQRTTGIWVLQATNMPAILVETGHINNYEDERYLASEKGQQEIAVAIAKAVIKYKDQFENNKTAQN